MSGLVEFLPLYNNPYFNSNWDYYRKQYKAWKGGAKWLYDDKTDSWRKVGAWKVLEKTPQGYNVIFDGDKKFIDYYGAYDLKTYVQLRLEHYGFTSGRTTQSNGGIPSRTQIDIDASGNIRTASEHAFKGDPVYTITLKKKRKSKNNEMQAEILKSPPIIIRHHSKGVKKTPFAANAYLTSNRTYEFTCAVGRMASLHTDYNTRDELDNLRNYACTNLVVQTGIGTKNVATDGISTNLETYDFYNQYKTYIMRQTRTYDVSNFSNGTVSIVMRVLTPRRELDGRLDTDISNVQFEESRLYGAQYIQWADNTASEGADNETLRNYMASDEINFDLFKHRYQVRRNWTQYGKRVCILHPGHSVRFVVIDQGPHMLSDIHLREGTNFMPGYLRLIRFEMRGVDMVANSTENNTMLSKCSGVCGIIETMHTTVRCALAMRTTSRTVEGDLSSSLGNQNTSGTVGYGRLGTFATSVQQKINPETEEKQTGNNDAR